MKTSPRPAGVQLGILGATGTIGRAVTAKALDDGHTVVALIRNPARLDPTTGNRVTVRAVDATDPDGLFASLDGLDAVISTLGLRSADPNDTFTTAAKTLSGPSAPPAVWLGSFGLGATRGAAGPILGPVFNWLLRRERSAKTAAERAIIDAGSTVVHALPFTDKPATGTYTLVPAEHLRPRLLVGSIPIPDIACLLVAEAVHPRHRGTVAAVARDRSARTP